MPFTLKTNTLLMRNMIVLQIKKLKLIFVESFESTIRRILNENATVSEVINAIDNKNRVKISYNGDNNTPSGERVIEPYLIGKTTAGNLAIRAYQAQGVTATMVPEWKIFILNKIVSWAPMEETFELRQDYNQYGDQSFTQITKKI